MSVRVDLLHEGGDAPLGAVVGAVDILDAGLRPVAGAVVRAGLAVEVDLPDGDLFFAHGRLASGERLTGALQVDVASRRARWRLDPVTRPAEAQGPIRDGWIRAWGVRDGAWFVDTAPATRLLPGRVEIGALSDAGTAGSPVVVQVALGDVAPRMCVLPHRVPLRAAVRPDTGEIHFTLIPGAADTLMRQMDAGDRRGADVTVAHLMAAAAGDLTGDPLTDLLIGYHLTATAAPDESMRWVGRVAADQPLSKDVEILVAYLTGTPERFVPDGLPVLRRGLRLAVDLVSDSTAAYRALYRYLCCTPAGPLVTFHGEDPATPALGPVPMARPPRDAVVFAPKERPTVSALTRLARRFLVPIEGHATLGTDEPRAVRSGKLSFPDEALTVLGDRAAGTATVRRGALYVVVDNVDAAALAGLRITVVVGDLRVSLVPHGSALTGTTSGVDALPRGVTVELEPADDA